jgi:hypothetical protein
MDMDLESADSSPRPDADAREPLSRDLLSREPSSGGPLTRDSFSRDPLWRDLIGEVLRGERRAQERTLQDVADEARISMPYLSELERGRKEASSEILAAAAQALGLRLSDLISLASSRLGEYEKVAATASRSSVGAVGRDSLCLAA